METIRNSSEDADRTKGPTENLKETEKKANMTRFYITSYSSHSAHVHLPYQGQPRRSQENFP